VKAPVLAIAVGKPKGPVGGDEEDSDERESFDSFAATAGIPLGKRDVAYDALVAMIQACIARSKSGGYEEEG